MRINAVLYCVVGLVLLIFPGTTATTLGYLLGVGAVAAGVCVVGAYLFRDAAENIYRNDFVGGLAAIAVGVFIFFKMDVVISIIPFVLGIAVIVSGFIKLQNCIDMRRMGYGNGWYLFGLAAVNMVLGIVLVLNPFHTAILLFRLIGLGLLFSGISDLFTSIYVSRKLKDYKKMIDVMEDDDRKWDL